MYTGPNIVNEGLVFGIDSGYGIANTGVPTRFFKGKPATNLASGLVKTFSNWAGLVGTTDYYTRNGSRGVHLIVTTGGGVQWHGSDQINSVSASTQYTISATIKWTGVTPDANLFYIRQYNSSGGQVTEGGHFSTSYMIDLGDGWYRVYRTFTTTSTTNYIRIQGYQYSTNANIYYQDEQFELGSQLTPYAGDSTARSNTDSLIDIKRTTSIDVSNISFNSTGQPTFDGTDDEINTGITTQLTDFSCVVIFKDGGSAAWGRLVDKQYTTGFFISSYFASVGNNYVGAGVREPSSPHGQALQYDDTKYNYFVVTRSGGTHTIYLNGSTNKVQKTNGDSSTLSSTEMAIGAWNGSTASQRYTGEIPVVKLYNKELTAAEIEQDFKAYKNRFNI